MDLDQYKNLDLEYYADWFLDSEVLQSNKYNNQLYPYDKLFSNFKLNQLTLKNRIVFNSVPDYNLADQMGRPGKIMRDHYAELAKGGVGLITTGSVPVSGMLDPTVIDEKGRSVFPQILNNESTLSGWTKLAEACQVYSAKVFISLSAGLGQKGLLSTKSKSNGLTTFFARKPISISGGKSFEQNLQCRRLSDRALEQLIDNFGQSARFAMDAGLDGVLLEGARSELLAQISDPAINKRKLGIFTNYQKFAVDIVRRIRRVNGADFPILYNIEINPEKPQTDFLKNLVQAGVDGFLIRFGGTEYPWLAQGARTLPPGYNLQLLESIRLYFSEEEIVDRNGQTIPLIISGKLDFPDIAEQILREDSADFVCPEDALLADPEWPNKVYRGQVEQIRPVIDSISDQNKIKKSSVNPSYLQEIQTQEFLSYNRLSKRIAIVGAGLAGIECAVAAHAKGHQIWLFDQESKVGGKLNKILIPNFRIDLANYLSWQQKRVAALTENSPRFKLVLNTIATMSMLDERKFDTIVVADGGKISPLKFENITEIIDILDVDLSDKAQETLFEQLNIAEKNRIIILGEHPLALDIAYNLVYAYDKQVSLLFEGEEKLDLEQNPESRHLLYFLKQKNVDIYYNVALKDFQKDKISFQSTSGKYDLSYDFVFKATKLEPNPDFYQLLYQYRIAPFVFQIGDSAKPGSFADNISSGFRLGINL